MVGFGSDSQGFPPVATDDLNTPLGQNIPRQRRFRLPFTAPQAIAAVLGVFLTAFLAFAIFGDDPMGGEPMTKAAYTPTQPADPATPPPAVTKPPPATASTAEPSGQKVVTIIDGSSGQRREMVIGAGDATPPGAASDAPAAPLAGVNPKLLENSRYGMIPNAADGLKPYRVYAGGSDLQRARAATTPSVAIVITGLGVGAAKTTDAIMKLPPNVTLAFTPYGSDPSKLVERARAQKHEVFLQVPMEPFDYPDNDPGPQTLLTTLNPDQNVDRLAWHMSRFQGYAGLANFMGSRFTVTEPALQPIMKEAAKRGLAYLDDGSASRSVASQLAQSQSVPFARADTVVDTVPTAVEIDRALARLESAARDRGAAVGVASALPISIDRIAVWAQQLESRGILLVPLTTAMMKSKSS